MKNKEKGELTEQIVVTEFMKRGIVCSKPFGDNQKYDLIIELNNTLHKVQVRTCYSRSTEDVKVCFQNRRINTKNKFTISLSKSVDFFVGYSYETNKVYVIGGEVLMNNSNSVVLRLTDTVKNKHILHRIKFAKDYELDNFLENYGRICR